MSWERQGRALRWRAYACLLAFALSGTASVARAQDGAPAAEPPTLTDTERAVGSGAWALPAIGRIDVPDPERAGVSFATSAGYAFTESVLGNNDLHHRVAGTLSAAFRPIPWLAIGVRVDGRIDMHTSDDGDDSSMVGEPKLLLRGSYRVSPELRLGLQTVVWFPGASAPSIVGAATSADVIAMLAWSPKVAPDQISPLTLALRAGFRIDQSAKAIDDPSTLSGNDRVALGLSSSHAVLVGVGMSYRVSRQLEALGEFSWDMLIGSNAPSLADSPMRIGAGVRYAADEQRAWLLSAMLDVGTGTHPLVDAHTVLPIEPRVGVTLGLAWRVGGDGTARAAVEEVVAVQPTPEPQRVAEPALPVQTTQSSTTSVRGTVVEDGAGPIADAQVTLVVDGRSFQARTSATGVFEFATVPAGQAHLSIESVGYERVELDAVLEAGAPSDATVPMVRAQPAGVLRGRVLSVDGAPVEATIQILTHDGAVSQNARTDANGAFEANVPPGRYQIVISAPGHDAQRRRVNVELGSVVDVSVNLRRSR